MYELHPVFISPEDRSVKVWRYMDFTKFVSVIESRTLHFNRADKFDDPFEGAAPVSNSSQRFAHISSWSKEQQFRAAQHHSDLNKAWRKYVAINCWHENRYESAAMWKLYLKSGEGVAICTTFDRLTKSFVGNEPIYVGRINYIDYDTDVMREGYSFSSFLHKRKSFEHEKEIRALLWKPPVSYTNEGIPDGTFDTSLETINGGVSVPVDLDILIDQLYVAPNAPKWFYDLVISVTRRYDIAKTISWSDLDKAPVF
jgi:hypothetical protein